MDKLSDDAIKARLEAFSNWTRTGDSLQRTLSFDDFKSSMAFVARVAEVAEQMQHHPDILVRYDKVTLTVSTHDAGGITDKDFEFAAAANGLMAGAA